MQLFNALRDRIGPLQDSPAIATIPPSECYEILQNERRRHIVEFLATNDDDVVPLCDIADYLVETMDDDRQACYISVLQQHRDAIATIPSFSASIVDGHVDNDFFPAMPVSVIQIVFVRNVNSHSISPSNRRPILE